MLRWPYRKRSKESHGICEPNTGRSSCVCHRKSARGDGLVAVDMLDKGVRFKIESDYQQLNLKIALGPWVKTVGRRLTYPQGSETDRVVRDSGETWHRDF